jgi:hypothetical protein
MYGDVITRDHVGHKKSDIDHWGRPKPVTHFDSHTMLQAAPCLSVIYTFQAAVSYDGHPAQLHGKGPSYQT